MTTLWQLVLSEFFILSSFEFGYLGYMDCWKTDSAVLFGGSNLSWWRSALTRYNDGDRLLARFGSALAG